MKGLLAGTYATWKMALPLSVNSKAKRDSLIEILLIISLL